ncbi:PmeII family type II restriction endonuclease [Minwuia sp. IMCC3009]|uniref:PmeII family type II restriction endonuclease n=1 Tax=Minwuia sp. IMCC3009 TaxID=3040674 RepID=UPI00247AE0F3|nr:PmeII family type II restriction endonuclease [Minwuia sp. IMCC3009]
MTKASRKLDLYDILKEPRHPFDKIEIKRLFALVDQARVYDLARRLKDDLALSLPAAYGRRKVLSDYRTNPYVLLATTNIMELSDPDRFADFLFNSKLTMGLETSFGKLIERAFVQGYPSDTNVKWGDPKEKIAEFEREKLEHKGRSARAAARSNSIWREIDKDVLVERRRYMTSIKSGPNTINDTQVQGMVDAIVAKHAEWLRQSQEATPELEGIDVVIGLTYGTERSTNNKENQILAKLLGQGFSELDQHEHPGVLVDDATGQVKVYRRIGKSFWSWIGNPADEAKQPQVFLEILLSLSLAFRALLADGTTIEEGINDRLRTLAKALLGMQLTADTLPLWIKEEGFEGDDLFYLVTALSAFYDEGI